MNDVPTYVVGLPELGPGFTMRETIVEAAGLCANNVRAVYAGIMHKILREPETVALRKKATLRSGEAAVEAGLRQVEARAAEPFLAAALADLQRSLDADGLPALTAAGQAIFIEAFMEGLAVIAAEDAKAGTA
jgi:hypothetical protein